MQTPLLKKSMSVASGLLLHRLHAGHLRNRWIELSTRGPATLISSVRIITFLRSLTIRLENFMTHAELGDLLCVGAPCGEQSDLKLLFDLE